MGQEFKSGFIGQFWLRISQAVAFTMSAEAASPEGLIGIGGSASKMANSQSCQQEGPVAHPTDLYIGCLSILKTWQLTAPEQVIQERKHEGSYTTFTPSFPFYPIL